MIRGIEATIYPSDYCHLPGGRGAVIDTTAEPA